MSARTKWRVLSICCPMLRLSLGLIFTSYPPPKACELQKCILLLLWHYFYFSYVLIYFWKVCCFKFVRHFIFLIFHWNPLWNNDLWLISSVFAWIKSFQMPSRTREKYSFMSKERYRIILEEYNTCLVQKFCYCLFAVFLAI